MNPRRFLEEKTMGERTRKIKMKILFPLRYSIRVEVKGVKAFLPKSCCPKVERIDGKDKFDKGEVTVHVVSRVAQKKGLI